MSWRRCHSSFGSQPDLSRISAGSQQKSLFLGVKMQSLGHTIRFQCQLESAVWLFNLFMNFKPLVCFDMFWHERSWFCNSSECVALNTALGICNAPPNQCGLITLSKTLCVWVFEPIIWRDPCLFSDSHWKRISCLNWCNSRAVHDYPQSSLSLTHNWTHIQKVKANISYCVCGCSKLLCKYSTNVKMAHVCFYVFLCVFDLWCALFELIWWWMVQQLNVNN